nr:hypothetical protein [Tanacetum cinerariifolium]
CLVTILNTKDHLGKFNGKADEGFFVGYSFNSKAFRVFNSRTRIVKENLHIRFSESTHNVVGKAKKSIRLMMDKLLEMELKLILLLKVNAARHNLLLLDSRFSECTHAKVCPNSCIEQFWSTAMTKNVNEESHIHAWVPQPSVIDEAVYKELDDRLVRAATTASSLEAEQDSGNIDKTQSKATPNEVSSLGTTSGCGPRGNTLRSDKDSIKLNELMKLCINLQSMVLDLEKTKTTQALEITSLKRRVKKIEKKQRLKTYKLKILYKVGLTARVDSSEDEKSLGEDANKQGRKINNIDADEDITLVNDQDDTEMFDVNDLHGEEVNAASIVTTDSVAATTTTEEVTLAKALVELKASKLKVKRGFIQDPSESTTTITKTISSIQSQDKGKGIMVEKPVKLKKKDQIRLDEEATLKLQAEFDEEQRLARKKAQKEQEASIALIETWDDVQVKIDADYQLAERLQEEEQQKLTDEEKATLFMQLLEKRRKFFAAKRLEQESSKKQKVDDDKEIVELKKLMEIIPNEEEVAIDAITLAVKSPKIVDWMIHKEGKKSYYQIIRADGNSKMYMAFNRMLKEFDREDLDDLYSLLECKKAGKRHLFVDPENNDDDVAYDDYEAALFMMKNPRMRRTEEAVQKLGLKTKNRPKPYKLQWLKRGGEVTVSKRVHVSFSIGTTYKDNVWCDVVAMDAYHLLLGRPWESSYKPTGTLLTLSQFKDELEMGDDIFVLIGKEVAEDSEIPEAMIPLLEEFINVFPDGLPPLHDIRHHIDLEPGSQLPNRPHYWMSPKEHEELRRQDGTWRMCVDSQAINKITMRYRFPIPRFDDLLDQISGATIFTKLDLKSGYYQILHRPGDEWKTAFKTHEGLYESLVMPFGLSNAPSLDLALEGQFYAATKKYVFMTPKVLFLAYVVSGDGIRVDESKVAAVQAWPNLTTITKVWSFHGLASFYRRFIPNFSSIMVPLTDCMKGNSFVWTKEVELAFQVVKEKLTTAPILVLPDFSKVFELHTDASKVVIGEVLSQGGRPIAYFSEKLTEPKSRYTTYDLEFYAVVQAVKHWRHYLFNKEFVLFTDHDSLRHIRTQDKLSHKNGRWLVFLEKFTFMVKHKTGVSNRAADALSRRNSLLVTMHVDVPGLNVTRDMVTMDPYFLVVFQGVQSGEKTNFVMHDGFLFKGNQLCIPDLSLRLQIIKELHREGHVGRDRTSQLVQASYFWPTMKKEADRYVKSLGLTLAWISYQGYLVLKGTTYAVNVAQLFFRDVYRLHGLPSSIVSDQDARSLGNLLRCLVGDHVKAWDQKLFTTAGTRVKIVCKSYYCQYKEVTTAQVEVSAAQELQRNILCVYYC